MEKKKVDTDRIKKSEVCNLCKREKGDMNSKNWQTHIPRNLNKNFYSSSLHIQTCKRKKEAKEERENLRKKAQESARPALDRKMQWKNF